MSTSALSAGLAFVALWLAACGDDGGTTVDAVDTGLADTAPDSAADTAPDAAEDTAADTAVADVTADVGPLARVSFQFLEWLDGPPVSGVSVRWTAPGGEMEEATSDDEGRVSFSGIDWSKGHAMIVAARPGYAVRGAAGDRASFESADVLLTAGGDIFVPMPAIGNAGWVHVTGNAVGADASGYLVVKTDLLATSASVANGTRFDLVVPPDTPFNWTAVSATIVATGDPRVIDSPQVGWATGQFPGTPDDAEMPLDLTLGHIASTSHIGSFPNVASDTSTLDEVGVGRVYVHGHSYNGLFGLTSSSSPREDGSAFDYEVEWIEPTWMTDPVTQYEIQSELELTGMLVPGLPPSADALVDLLAPPSWTSAAQTAIDQPLTWDALPDGVRINVVLTDGVRRDAPELAVFFLGAGTTSFTLPRLAGDVDLFALAESAQLGVRAVACETDVDAIGPGRCARYAHSAPHTIVPSSD